MKNNNILWEDCKEIVENERICFLENKMRVKFPPSFLECMKKCNGGVPNRSEFDYYDTHSHRIRGSGVGRFLNLCESRSSSFLGIFQHPPEFFPEGLIAFAENGGGDYICFDYRKNKENSNPIIVLWNHEDDIGKDVFFLANNFEEFIEMLKIVEELE